MLSYSGHFRPSSVCNRAPPHGVRSCSPRLNLDLQEMYSKCAPEERAEYAGPYTRPGADHDWRLSPRLTDFAFQSPIRLGEIENTVKAAGGMYNLNYGN